MKIPQGRDKHVSNTQDSDLWITVSNEETGQRQDFNDYKLIQEEFLRNLGLADNIEQPYAPEKSGKQDNRQMSQIL